MRKQSTIKRADVYQLITKRIIERLEQGVIPWKQGWSAQGAPKNLITGKPYKGFNSFFLTSFEFGSSYFLTLRQCNELEGKVKKGMHGFPVIYWKVSYKLPSGEYSNGAGLTLEQRISYQKAFLLRYYTVFNTEQCDYLEKHIPPTIDSMNDPIMEAEQIIKSYTDRPEIKQGGDQAYYIPVADYVQMPRMGNFESAESFYSTLFHELIHSTGHSKRLNRVGVADRTVKFGTSEYSKEELIAELGASFLNNHAGFTSDELMESSSGYIQMWIRVLENDPKMIFNASGAAQKAAEYILNLKETEETEIAAEENVNV